MKNSKICGRFAPTPSGRIHLGNIFCSLLAWLHAKSQGGEIVLRIEDLDKVRCPRSNADLLAKDLEWLGLTWDKGAYVSEDSECYFQSQRFDIYAEHFRKLEDRGLIYPCFCSRGQLHAAEAPHLSSGRNPLAGRTRCRVRQGGRRHHDYHPRWRYFPQAYACRKGLLRCRNHENAS